MSGSVRKTPICGMTTAESEAFDKARWHRAFRRAQRAALTSGDGESLHYRAYSSTWTMHKDGKQWFAGCESAERLMRK